MKLMTRAVTKVLPSRNTMKRSAKMASKIGRASTGTSEIGKRSKRCTTKNWGKIKKQKKKSKRIWINNLEKRAMKWISQKVARKVKIKVIFNSLEMKKSWNFSARSSTWVCFLSKSYLKRMKRRSWRFNKASTLMIISVIQTAVSVLQRTMTLM